MQRNTAWYHRGGGGTTGAHRQQYGQAGRRDEADLRREGTGRRRNQDYVDSEFSSNEFPNFNRRKDQHRVFQDSNKYPDTTYYEDPDNEGYDRSNQTLSERRAKQLLTSGQGVAAEDCHRGSGELNPVAEKTVAVASKTGGGG
jgi:hypothetical protein